MTTNVTSSTATPVIDPAAPSLQPGMYADGFTTAIVPSTPPESPYETPLFCLADIRGITQHLTGRLKTLIDGAVADPIQRKALKDLIHTMVWEEHFEPNEKWAYMAVDRRADNLGYTCPPFSKTSIMPPEGRF